MPAGGRRSTGSATRARSTSPTTATRRASCSTCKTAEGREVLFDLVRTADAVVENFRPGVLERLGSRFDRLRAVESAHRPSLGVGLRRWTVPTAILPAYDLILQAMTGHMSIMGEAGRPPVIMGIPIADLLAGVFAALGVLARRRVPARDRAGRTLDIAMFDVMVEMLAHVGTLYLNTGIDQEPAGFGAPVHHAVAGVPVRGRPLHRGRSARGAFLDEALRGARRARVARSAGVRRSAVAAGASRCAAAAARGHLRPARRRRLARDVAGRAASRPRR